jgi:acyl dehydratase
MTAKRTYHFTEKRVKSFARLVDDLAPVHRDVGFALNQGFDGPIVHGLFVQSILSGVMGNALPGALSVINTLNMKMHLPVLVGQKVDYQVEIAALTPAVKAVSLSFSGTVDGTVVISGKALCHYPEPLGR